MNFISSSNWYRSAFGFIALLGLVCDSDFLPLLASPCFFCPGACPLFCPSRALAFFCWSKSYFPFPRRPYWTLWMSRTTLDKKSVYALWPFGFSLEFISLNMVSFRTLRYWTEPCRTWSSYLVLLWSRLNCINYTSYWSYNCISTSSSIYWFILVFSQFLTLLMSFSW